MYNWSYFLYLLFVLQPLTATLLIYYPFLILLFTVTFIYLKYVLGTVLSDRYIMFRWFLSRE